jgi:hypothetical protein
MAVHYTEKVSLKEPWGDIQAFLIIISVVLAGILAMTLSLLT